LYFHNSIRGKITFQILTASSDFDGCQNYTIFIVNCLSCKNQKSTELNFNLKYDLLVITGPTAVGKTSLAAAVAGLLDGEIISADSRQVYKGMNIGTGKDYGDYYIEGRKIPFHLIDIVDPGYKYNLFEYHRDFMNVYRKLKARTVFPVVCGGSGMYVDSVVSAYSITEVPPDNQVRKELEEKSMEELMALFLSYRNPHNISDFDTKKRLIRAIEIEQFSKGKNDRITDSSVLKSLVIGVSCDRDLRRKRISDRLSQRFEEGMVGEVEQLIEKGVPVETLLYYGLEYKFITLYLTGHLKYDNMVRQLEIAIHQFAKRQMTWFRGMERKGIKINWIDTELPLNEKLDKINQLLAP
jgi:tRNA dimethylallyltransferase